MNIPILKNVIKGRVKFLHYRDNELWYKTEIDGFEFPIHIDDAQGATFLAEDKAIFFMRWIRKRIEMLNGEMESPTVYKADRSKGGYCI